MIVYPLNRPETSTYRNIIKWSKRLKIPIGLRGVSIKSLLIVGDGTPDEIVSMLLLHKFNGKEGRYVGILKPEYLRLEAIRSVVTLINQSSFDVVMLFLDQEDDDLNELWGRVEEKIGSYFTCSRYISNVLSAAEASDRLRIFKCQTVRNSFLFAIVINGLSDFPCEKHTIEDHLVKLAIEKLGLDRKYSKDKGGCSKDLWNSYSRNDRIEVFNLIINLPVEEVSVFFPQHLEAILNIQSVF